MGEASAPPQRQPCRGRGEAMTGQPLAWGASVGDVHSPSFGERTQRPSEGYTRFVTLWGFQHTVGGAFAASDAAGLVGPHGDLDAVSGAELSHEAGKVGFDGAWGDVELAGDLIVGAALGYRHEDFLLAGGERF